ncbi:CAP domain-containing protein [Jimgerdemannia flammicorona]|uniref:CAP domain-containing protein n=1 Tax=Jimgerdemannia flammicorona TaxID=994334 RepID=A0A433QI99_9FUNG|nr:CAP domain-containing protein [Jimgerdemannia flammicorona]
MLSTTYSMLVTLASSLLLATASANPILTKRSIYQDEINTILQEHNRYRARHGSPPLVWDTDVASSAEQWASTCSGMDHPHSGGPNGENVGFGYPDWQSVIAAWYNEVSKYNYNDPESSTGTGHFTAVVWKSTTKIGCGYSKCNDEYGNRMVCQVGMRNLYLRTMLGL